MSWLRGSQTISSHATLMSRRHTARLDGSYRGDLRALLDDPESALSYNNKPSTSSSHALVSQPMPSQRSSFEASNAEAPPVGGKRSEWTPPEVNVLCQTVHRLWNELSYEEQYLCVRKDFFDKVAQRAFSNDNPGEPRRSGNACYKRFWQAVDHGRTPVPTNMPVPERTQRALAARAQRQGTSSSSPVAPDLLPSLSASTSDSTASSSNSINMLSQSVYPPMPLNHELESQLNDFLEPAILDQLRGEPPPPPEYGAEKRPGVDASSPLPSKRRRVSPGTYAESPNAILPSADISHATLTGARWTQAEDNAVVSLQAEYAARRETNKWQQVSADLWTLHRVRRTANAARQRWYDHLKPMLDAAALEEEKEEEEEEAPHSHPAARPKSLKGKARSMASPAGSSLPAPRQTRRHRSRELSAASNSSATSHSNGVTSDHPYGARELAAYELQPPSTSLPMASTLEPDELLYIPPMGSWRWIDMHKQHRPTRFANWYKQPIG